MSLYIKKSEKKINIFKKLFKNFNDDDTFYDGGETMTKNEAPTVQGTCHSKLFPPH